jgi:hypothetical protein
MKTDVTLTSAERGSLLREAREFRLRYLLGRLLLPLRSVLTGEWFRLLFRRVDRFDSILAQSDYERLPPALLKELLEVQRDQVDHKAEHRATRYLIDDQTINAADSDYAFAAREAVKLLNEHSSLRSIANIGARVDVITNYLSAKYPDRAFASIDLQQNLAEHNRFFEMRPNWEFRPGYIIDMLEKGYQVPDLVIMQFTSCKFTGREFERFLALSKNLKAILLLATYKPNPNSILKFSIERPDQLSESYVASPTLLDPDIPSYIFVHNYPKILSAYGFKVDNSAIRRAANPVLRGAANFVTATRNLS